MKEMYLVTGNPGKLRELQTIFPDTIKLRAKKLDLPEIQSLDSEEIVRDKLDRAFDLIKKPVVVEDVSAALACLNGLPGPFIRYFEDKLGKDALYKLARHADDKHVTICCTMGYFDGQARYIVSGEIRGTVTAPRGQNGFGFDFVFVPEGETRTTAEMSPAEKNQISHRALAIKELLAVLSLAT